MGSRQREYDRMMREMQAMLTRAQQPSPYEQELATDRANIRNFLNSGDYRNLPKGVGVNLLPLSDYQRMSKMMSGSGDNVAKGALTQDALQNRRELDNNKLVRDWGGAYEQEIGNLRNEQAGMTDALQGMHTNRMNVGLQGSQMMLQNVLNRPKSTNWFGQIFGMASQALPGILAAI